MSIIVTKHPANVGSVAGGSNLFGQAVQKRLAAWEVAMYPNVSSPIAQFVSKSVVEGPVNNFVLKFESNTSLAQDPQKTKLSPFLCRKLDVLRIRCRSKVYGVLVKVGGSKRIGLAGIECSEDLLQVGL